MDIMNESLATHTVSSEAVKEMFALYLTLSFHTQSSHQPPLYTNHHSLPLIEEFSEHIYIVCRLYCETLSTKCERSAGKWKSGS